MGNQARIWHIMVIFDLSRGSARLAIALAGEARELLPSKLVIRTVELIEIRRWINFIIKKNVKYDDRQFLSLNEKVNVNEQT